MIYIFKTNIYAEIIEHGRHISLHVQKSEKRVLSLLIANTQFGVNCHLYKEREREWAVW